LRIPRTATWSRPNGPTSRDRGRLGNARSGGFSAAYAPAGHGKRGHVRQERPGREGSAACGRTRLSY
jgi:hypothetical protein